MDTSALNVKFVDLYKTEPRIFKSPGRINLIGEHTDYNDGFVMPAAIDKSIVVAMGKNDEMRYRIFSIDFDACFEIKTSDLRPQKSQWSNYILGVIAQFQKLGKVNTGIDVVFGGDVPIGAGLSSSAALECAVAYGVNELFGLNFSKLELVKMAQKAEHEYVGVNCGIMDQFASMFGSENKAIQLDCRSLDFSYFPIDLSGYKIILYDTNVKHSLASSAYNTRRAECEKGVEIIASEENGVKSLRDVSLTMLKKYEYKIPKTIFKRCKYVIEENERILKAGKALENNKIAAFGDLLYASHTGLMNEYEVSCKELDFLYEFAKNHDAAIGARMMGGGFGGCTINIIKESEVENFSQQISQAYYKATNTKLSIYTIDISGGTQEI